MRVREHHGRAQAARQSGVDEAAGVDAAGIDPADVKAILTGGLSAAPWARALEGIDAIDPDLTLKGLAILHAEVSGGEPLELGLLR